MDSHSSLLVRVVQYVPPESFVRLCVIRSPMFHGYFVRLLTHPKVIRSVYSFVCYFSHTMSFYGGEIIIFVLKTVSMIFQIFGYKKTYSKLIE